MTEYTARTQRVIFTQQELDALKAMLDGGDRGGFYMTYNAMTDSAEAMLQAKVATFSGLVGGAAFAANRFLQDEFGVDGTETPGRYKGVYYLSQMVALSAYTAIEESAAQGGDGTGKISDSDFFDTAVAAWANAASADLFPGNFLLTGSWSDLFTPGALAALAATPYAQFLGKGVSDYDPSQVVTIADGVKVAYDQFGRIEAVFANTVEDFYITAGAILAGGTATDSTLNHLFGGVMPNDPAARADIRAGFKESNTSSYNGDIDPLLTNNHDSLEYAFSTTGTSQSDLILTMGSVDAGSGDDVIIGETAAQDLKGGAGDDIIWGREGKDTIDGGSNDDVLRGGADDDTIKGGAGNDFIDGGDVNLARASDGTDKADYSDATGGVTIDFTNQTKARLDETFIEVSNDGYGGQDTLHSIEKIQLSQTPDTLKATRDSLSLDLKIDMGESNRQESPFNLDVYDLSDVSEGLTYRSGKVALGWSGPLSTFIGLAENLEVKNADKIILTDFNDTVVSANFGNVIHTGGGADKIWIGSDGVAIDDLSKDDRLTIAGVLPLFGGIRVGNFDHPYGYSWGGAVRWAEDVSGALQVSLFGGATTYILNWGADSAGKTADQRPGNISLFTATFEGVYVLSKGLPSNASIMGWWDLFGALVKTHTGYEVWKGVDPLTLDLDGDGLELTGPNALSASFDFNADGYAERAGWVRPDDGILVRDINNNSRIDNVTEMFGGTSSGFAQLGTLDGNQDGKVDAADNELADFNGDGTVDANDTISALKVWRDFNENGVTEAGELFSLADLGIASISVNGTAQQNLFEEGNQITATGSFTRTDGSTGLVADVLYRVDNSYTHYVGDPITITADAAALPDHKGHGTLVSLREAMSLDEDFATTVEDTVPLLGSVDLGNLRTAALPILTGWAVASPLTDADSNPNTNPPKLLPHNDVHILVHHDQFGGESVVDYAYQTSATVEGQTVSYWALGSGRAVVNSGGVTLPHPTLAQLLAAPQTLGTWALLDGDLIAFVERYIGEALPVDRVIPAGTVVDPGTVDIFNTILATANLAAVRIAVQDGPLSSFFASIEYDSAGNSFHAAAGNDRQLIPVFEAVFNEAIAQNHGASWLSQWTPLLDVVTGDYVRGASFLSMNYAFLAQNIVAAYESTGIALTFDDVASAFGIPDDLIISGSGTLTGTTEADIIYAGTAGNDTLRGGEGPDTYIFGQVIGHDTIDDIEPALTADHVPDTIRFASLSHSDVTATRDGLDLILTVNATGETITVLRQFEGYRPGLFGGDISEETGVAVIVFADGVTWEQQDIAKAVSHPLASDDTIVGTPSLDWLDGGAGDDHLSGGDDADVYIFDRGYGHDVIQEAQTNILINTWDIVRFGEGITEDDVTFSRDGNSADLEISINDTDDTLIVAGQFVANYTMIFEPNWFQRIEFFIFDDGNMITWQQVMEDLVARAKTEGDDTIYGFSVEDMIDGGAGNDYLFGGNGNDIFVYGNGYGNDVIHEGADNILGGMVDTLRFNADVLPEDVTFTRVGSTPDLLITLASGETLKVEGQFDAFASGPFGTLWFDRIEYFEFTSTGAVLTAEDAIQRILTEAKTTGDDEIYGYFREDVLDGGAGDDYLAGAAEGDTYIFGHGYGHDVVLDQDGILGDGDNIDRVVFAADISPSDLQVSRPVGTNDLVFTIASTGETLTIREELDKSASFANFNLVEEFRFADGTIWTADIIRPRLLAEAKTAGDDTIVGFYTADLIDGGAGNDVLRGAGGGDTYVWGRGYGQDTLDSYIVYITRDAPDTLEFTSDVLPSDLHLERVGDDLIFTIDGATDRLIVQTQFSGLGYWTIESFQFANGTTWTWQDVQVFLLAATSGDDVINGYDATGDTLDGGAGNDRLVGGGGDDTYVFGRGYGRDVINDDNPNPATAAPDRVLFNADTALADLEFVRVGQADLIIRINGTEDELTIEGEYWDSLGDIANFEFASGTVLTFADVQAIIAQNGPGHVTHRGTAAAETMNGSSFDDVIDGRGGADILNGGFGADVYLFGAGSGNDSIQETGGASNIDILKLNGLNVEDVTIGRIGQNLTVTINATGETVTVTGHFYPSDGIEQIAFADGTTWDRATIFSNVVIRGTSGNDTLSGTGDPDVLDGGAGNDTLSGGAESDTYIYGVGSGNDVIAENSDSSATDTIKLVGLNPADLTLSRSGQDLIVAINATGEKITVAGHYWGTREGVEQLAFADGTIWNRATMQDKAWFRGTSGNDTINGSGDQDTIDGGGGNDTLNGGGESDTYIFGAGSGNDTISGEVDSGATDTIKLVGLNPADVTLTRSGQDLIVAINATGEKITVVGHYWGTREGIEQLAFADGTIWNRATIQNQAWFRGTAGNDSLEGTGEADTLDGGAGNDTLNGWSGSDTFIFQAGSGNDTIAETSDSSATDVVKLVGLNPADVTLSRTGNNLIVVLNATGEQLTISGHFLGTVNGIEQIVFADGTMWDRARIALEAPAIGTAGNDSMYGSSSDDSFLGALGNDYLEGGIGNDTYIFRLGDGQDTISDWGSGSDVDVLRFAAGISAADVTVTQINGSSLRLSIAGSSDTITLGNQLNGAYGGVDQVRFADDTVWDRETVFQKSLAPTSGNDTVHGDYRANTLSGGAGNDSLYGRGGNDQLSGNAGNDYLEGGDGNDTYLFNIGDGQDRIFDWGSGSDVDTLQFGAGIATGDVTVTLAGNGADILLSINGTSDSVLLDDRVVGAYAGADQVRFDDGTVWDYTTLHYMATHHAPTGAPTISGTATEDQTLTANTSGIQDLDGFGTLHYQWQRSANGGSSWTNVGADQSTYMLGDADAGSIVRVTVSYTDGGGTVESLTSSATGAVVNINHTPVGVNDNKAVIDGAAVTGSVLANDTDADSSDTLRVSSVSNATSGSQPIASGGNVNIAGAYGTLTLYSDGSYSYTPNAGVQNTSDVFTYMVADPANASATATLTFNITGDANTFTGTAGDDTLTGTADPDTLDGLGGNDILIGGGGADTLVGGTGTDTASYASAPVAVVASLASPGDNTGHAAGDTYSGIENLTGSAFNDTLTGDANANVLDGGAGNDTLGGGTGGDTYVHRSGSGNDTVNDTSTGSGEVDKLKLVGIVPANVVLNRSGNNLIVTRSDTGETVTVQNHFNTTGVGIEQIVFDDNTIWDRTYIGGIHGTSGNDTIWGTSGDDAFFGHLGNDILRSGAGNDIFVYAAGDGNDEIDENSGSTTDVDVLRFTDINASGVLLTKSGQHLFVDVLSTGARITVDWQFYSATQNWGVEQIQFADGTSWDRAYIVANAAIRGTSGNDTLWGTSGDDLFIGGLGNDIFRSGAGSDTYSYVSGDGNDEVDENSGSNTDVDILKLVNLNPGDVALGRSGSHAFVDVLSTGARIMLDWQFYSATENWGVEQIQFADGTSWNRAYVAANAAIRGTSGNDTLWGTSGNDVFIGGLGNDTLRSGAGSDVHLYASGDGNDWIDEESGSNSEVDTLRFTNLNASDITLTRSGVHLVVNVASTSHTITLDEQYWSASANWGVDRFEFADGTSWNRDQIMQNAWQYGAASNDTLSGWGSSDNIDGGGGNDSLFGNGGADKLVGNTGNDWLQGGTGDDTYVFRLGDGQDTIDEEGEDSGSADRVLFGTSISVSDLQFSASGNNLVIKIAGTTDQITVVDGLWSLYNNPAIARDRVEYFDLADGTRIALTEVQLALLNGTSGNETINGYVSDDTLDGKAGNDTLNGNNGNDILIGGAGADTLNGGSGNDIFRYQTAGDSVSGSSDTISDFMMGSDDLDFSGIDANTSGGSDDAFAFVATQTTDVIANSITWSQSGGNTIVRGDIDGDGVADVTVTLTGLKSLTANDFYL